MAGGKGKTTGGKAGPKEAAGGKPQKSHSAKAGLQVRFDAGAIIGDAVDLSQTATAQMKPPYHTRQSFEAKASTKFRVAEEILANHLSKTHI
jgi:hypothetical protein